MDVLALFHPTETTVLMGEGEGQQQKRTERGEEPSVLAAGVSLLENLLDSLLGVLALGNLLEGVVGDGALEALKLQGVAGGHQVVVVDDLDEGLDLVSLLLAGLGHAAGDLGGVALNAGNQGVAERVRLVAVVNGLDDDNLLKRFESAIRVFDNDEPNDSIQHVAVLLFCASSPSTTTHGNFFFPPPTPCSSDGAKNSRGWQRGMSRASYLLSGVSAAGDDGDSADLEELHLVRWVVGLCWYEVSWAS